MNAEIICVGTELLLGDVVNTNATYIAKELAKLGINCYTQTVVGDNPKRLAQTFELSAERSDLVIITGGLGPTYDDLTKETIAQYFGLELKLDQDSFEKIKAIFDRRGREMTPNNEKQAMIPEGAIVLENNAGTAPGIIIESGSVSVIMLPGPPRELKAMFEAKVLPYLQKKSDRILLSHTVHLTGVGESAVELILHDYMLEMENPTIAPYAKEGEMYLRITAAGINKAEAEKLIEPVLEKVVSMFPEYVYGIDVDSLQAVVISTLIQQEKTITVIEDITGGVLINLLNTVIDGNKVTSGLVEKSELAFEEGIKRIEKYKETNNSDVIILLSGDLTLKLDDINQKFEVIITYDGKTIIETLEAGFGYEKDYNRIRYLLALQTLAIVLKILRK